MDGNVLLKTPDYVMIAIMLFIPLGIGTFFAVRDTKNNTRVEYLLAGKRMSMIPVGLSIFVTYFSAIGLLGLPTDVYMHGPMTVGMDLGVVVSYIFAYFVSVPLLHPLQLTSIFEYVELRYKSREVRLLCTIMGILQTFCYMTVALLAPGLALEAAADIPLWMSVVIVGTIGSVYTAVGGIKSVIWTDVFQVLVLFMGLYAVIITAIGDVGGLQKVFEINKAGQRMNFDSFSADPRVRHTWWSTVIGACFVWLTTAFNQSTVQRITTMRNLRSAQRTMLMIIGVHVVNGLSFILFGWCLYSYLYHIRCDPIKAGLYSNYNQLVPFFVMHVMQETPGMAGLYMSSIFSASLSTLSSGLNAMAANTVEDILQKPMKSVSEKTSTTITKVLVMVYGAAVIAMAYAAKSVQGPVSQLSMTVVGVFGSCIVGTISLGFTVPWANKYGAIAGVCTSAIINLWLGIGARLYGKSTPPLAPVPSDQCFNSSLMNSLEYDDIKSPMTRTFNISNSDIRTERGDSRDEYSMYDISYLWYAFIGMVICYTVGLAVSRITKSSHETNTDPRLILSCLRPFWNLGDPIETVEKDEVNGESTC